MDLRAHLLAGQVIPAHPLALTAERLLDERRQRALTRYYVAAGAGGMAVAVHTTQFAIREAGLFHAVLELASVAADAAQSSPPRPFVKVAGICGATAQAVHEAETALACGYHAGLLSLAALKDADEDALIAHSRAVADAIPVIGFYLQPAVGGRVLPYHFWRRFAEIGNVVAVKVAPFNRYQTLDVVRALAESGREDISLYTGNDDGIVFDLLSRFQVAVDGHAVERRFAGGLLGQWAVGTRAAVRMLERLKRERTEPCVSSDWMRLAAGLTDLNAAVFDAANGFRGCIAGVHEVLRRDGLLEGVWCLDPDEGLSPGQSGELDRVLRAWPELLDTDFIAAHRDDWLA